MKRLTFHSLFIESLQYKCSMFNRQDVCSIFLGPKRVWSKSDEAEIMLVYAKPVLNSSAASPKESTFGLMRIELIKVSGCHPGVLKSTVFYKRSLSQFSFSPEEVKTGSR